jgi:hypothetical protein
MTWEYRFMNAYSHYELRTTLDSCGASGFELVSLWKENARYFFVFKRRCYEALR